MKINIKGPIVSNDLAEVYEWFGMECCAPKTVNDQLEQAGDEEITLEINSGGGLCTAGFEIYETLRSHKAHITANVIYAASAASIIACGADETLMADASIMMIHNTQSMAEGDYRDMAQESKVLKEFNKSLINVYQRKTGKTAEELQRMMDKDTWMSPQEAIDQGFADGWIHGEPTGEIQVAAAETGIISPSKAKEFLQMIKKPEAFRESLITIDDMEHLRGTIAENGGDAFQNTETINTEENGGRDMKLDEFLAANPEAQAELDQKINDGVSAALDELVTAAREEGAANENARLKELDEIASSVTPEALEEAKYGENRIDAKTMAYEAMKNEQLRRREYMTAAMEDANAASEVGTQPTEEPVNNEGQMMAQYVNAKKEGKNHGSAE